MAPVSFRVILRSFLLVHKCFKVLGPSYLIELLLPYEPPRALRASGADLRTVPESEQKPKESSGSREASSVEQPTLWHLRTPSAVRVFLKEAKVLPILHTNLIK